MSRDWTKEELHTASEVMKQNGDTEFEEFWHALEQKQPVKFGFQKRNRTIYEDADLCLFWCFLLWLGIIGDKYKASRRI